MLLREIKGGALDWTGWDERTVWSVRVLQKETGQFALTWIGRTDGEDEAVRLALRCADIAHRVAAAIEKVPLEPATFAVGSTTPDADDQDTLLVGEAITRFTMIPERRMLRRKSARSTEIEHAAGALLKLGAASAAMHPGQCCLAGIGQDGLSDRAKTGVALYEDYGGYLGEVALPDALRLALAATTTAQWMTGSLPTLPFFHHVVGRGDSATLAAAERAGLVRDAPQRLAESVAFLRKLGLEGEARNLQEAFSA